MRSLTILTIPLTLLALGPAAPGQGRSSHRPVAPVEDVPSVTVVFDGIVLGADGAPADGALVESSAGGRSTTGPGGLFRLDVRVPLEVASVQLTATARDGASSKAITVPVFPGTTFLEPMVLEQSTRCRLGWLPPAPRLPGPEATIHALAVFDDGGGPALYAGGGLCGQAGNRLARWSGSSWTSVDSEMDGAIFALAEFDDGTGPALYAGGDFTTVEGVPARRIAKWDGAQWSALGTGTATFGNLVGALAVFDDGGGPALYAGGDFTNADGVPVRDIGRWDGTSWSALDGGVNDGFHVSDLAVFDDGSGPALYAGGSFTAVGGVAANNIAKWNGSTWSALGSGVSPSAVRSLAVFDDGSGPALFAGGDFTGAGGVAANRIARWDGSSWSALGSGITGVGGLYVDALAVFDDGSGPALHAGGDFTVAGGVPAIDVARWDGSSWSPLGSGTIGAVWVLSAFDDGNGPALFVGGSFVTAGGTAASSIARWDGASWKALLNGFDSDVRAFTTFDDGSGPALHAGGEFEIAGNVAAEFVAKWDGESWAPVGGGVNGDVHALAVFDDGSGPALHAAGAFTSAGGVPASRIAKWDGASWSPLGSGISPFVFALAVFDDGSGPALFAGGNFTSAGGVPASGIARWDGSSWSALGSGVAVAGTVKAMTTFEGALYVGGFFASAGGVQVNGIARWNGASWSPLGSGMAYPTFGPSVDALAVFDDGGGAALHAGGRFTTAGGVAAEYIAKWDGSGWSAVGSSLDNQVFALTVHDDGSGAALYAGGAFTAAGQMAVNRVAKWDGSSWSALGSGLSASVRALAPFQEGGSSPVLFVGGEFRCAPVPRDAHLARWGCRSWLTRPGVRVR